MRAYAHTHIRTYAHTYYTYTSTIHTVWHRCKYTCVDACIYHSHYFTLTHKTSELCMILRIYKITTLMTFHVTHFSYKIIQILSGQANRSGCALTRKGHNSNCRTGACCTVLLSLSVVF
jgi:hypothetical protein